MPEASRPERHSRMSSKSVSKQVVGCPTASKLFWRVDRVENGRHTLIERANKGVDTVCRTRRATNIAQILLWRNATRQFLHAAHSLVVDKHHCHLNTGSCSLGVNLCCHHQSLRRVSAVSSTQKNCARFWTTVLALQKKKPSYFLQRIVF